jgi:hypothetical protein
MPTGFIENERSSITTDSLITAKHQASFLAERLLVAYYARDKVARDYHTDQAHEALRAVAEHMGYALAHLPKSDALPTDWIDDDSNEDERNGLVIHNIAS